MKSLDMMKFRSESKWWICRSGI